MKVSLKLISTESEISKAIVNALKEELNTYLRDSSKKIVIKVRELLRFNIENSETWTSLQSGKLKAHFGLGTDGSEKLNSILDIWLNSVQIDYKPVTGTTTFRGGLSLQMVQTDWEDVLSSDGAIITTAIGGVLPWLDWLLIQGDKTIIIKDYDISMKPSSRSRSGMAIMVSKKGGGWRVPVEYAGTIDNNFMTNILDKLDTDITAIIEKELK